MYIEITNLCEITSILKILKMILMCTSWPDHFRLQCPVAWLCTVSVGCLRLFSRPKTTLVALFGKRGFFTCPHDHSRRVQCTDAPASNPKSGHCWTSDSLIRRWLQRINQTSRHSNLHDFTSRYSPSAVAPLLLLARASSDGAVVEAATWR